MGRSHHQPGDQLGEADRALLPRGRLARWAMRFMCRRTVGHCWHLERDASPMDPDWWCCECPAATAGIPPQNCVFCRADDGGGAPPERVAAST